MGALIDITGKKFGRLLVLERHDLFSRHARWKCLCDCGENVYVNGISLRTGHTQSCGCLNREISSISSTRHGKAGSTTRASSAEYRAWNGMLQRCGNQKSKFYSHYGARGIKVCERWKDFSNFYADMGGRPDGTSLDRIDNDRGYEPGNCRWTDKKTQQNNTRRNVFLEYGGVKKTVTQWAELLNIKPHTLRTRMNRGWSIERAFTQKLQSWVRVTGAPGSDKEERSESS